MRSFATSRTNPDTHNTDNQIESKCAHCQHTPSVLSRNKRAPRLEVAVARRKTTSTGSLHLEGRKGVATYTAVLLSGTDGLKTLAARGGIFLHEAPNVGHSCWVRDYTTFDGKFDCKFQPVYDQHVYPVVRDPFHSVVRDSFCA
ncbi:hypothetical protein FI667_g16303, partial [Globisporangium splendens]